MTVGELQSPILHPLHTGPPESGILELPALSEEFKRFASRTRDVVYRYDLASREYVFWNEVGLLTFGSRGGADRATRRSVSALILFEDRERVRRAARRSRVSRSGYGEVEYRIRYPDGAIRWMHDRWTVIRDASNRAVAIEGVVRDETDRKEAEAALRESRERYRRLVETMNDGLVVTDAEEIVTYANERFCSMLGYPSGELVGRPVAEFIHPSEARFLQEQVARRRRGERKPYEILWAAKGGRDVPTIVSPEPIFGEGGGFEGSFAVVTDIGEQKAIQHMLEARERELETQTRSLEDLIRALRVLLKRRDADQAELRRSFVQGLAELVTPYLDRLTETDLSPEQHVLLGIVAANLKEVGGAPEGPAVQSPSGLSAAEARVANLVAIGRSTKEIAGALSVSTRTVETHRYNIRKKLRIRCTGERLRSHLRHAGLSSGAEDGRPGGDRLELALRHLLPQEDRLPAVAGARRGR